MAEAQESAGRSALAGVPLEMFRDLCEHAQDLIQSVAPDGRLLYVNPAWCATLGYSADEASRMKVFDVIDRESLDHCMAAFGEVMKGGRLHNVEFAFRAKDGRRVDVFGSAVARFDRGAPVATSAVFHEVTEARRLDLERKRLFELSLDLLCIAGTDGYFRQINPAFGRVLGYSDAELMSRPFVDFVHPDDLEGTYVEIGRLNAGEPSVDFKNRYLAKDGTYRWLSWRAAPLAGLGLIYAVARDITAERETHALLAKRTEALARSNADLEQFAYTASHDLRAPLRGIRKLAGWIAEDAAANRPEKLEEHLAQMRERVDRMDALIEDLLHFYRAGQGRDEVENVDAATLVANIAALRGDAEGFRIRAEGPLPVFQTARAPLELVLRNLIGNAIQHHDRPQGTVTVSAKQTGDRYAFAVTDDGPGVPAEQREKVFGLFHRLSTTERASGTGMGLALVRRIVERYGGRVKLEAAAPRGTRAVFTWPVVIANGEAGHAPTADR